MIVYPSIEGPTFECLDQPCVAFRKYDGSNLRFFWDHKKGWHKSGTRHRWFDAANPMFGSAIELFQKTYAPGIVEVLRQHKEYRDLPELVAFCEFFGPNTFAGIHQRDEPKQLVLFDIRLPHRGLIPPQDFVNHFQHLPIAEVIYQGPLSKKFINDIRVGKYPVDEGVVAKGTEPRRQRKGTTIHEVWMAKVKTQAWLDEVQRRTEHSPSLLQEFQDNRREQASWEDQGSRSKDRGSRIDPRSSHRDPQSSTLNFCKPAKFRLELTPTSP